MKKSAKTLHAFLLMMLIALGMTGGAFGRREEFKSPSYIIPQPVLEWQKVGAAKGSEGKTYLNLRFGIKNWQAFPDQMFAHAPDLLACGLNKNSSQMWLDIYDYQTGKYIYGFCALKKGEEMKSLNFNVAREEKPDCIYITLTDRRANTIYKSNPIRFTSDRSCPLKKEIVIH